MSGVRSNSPGRANYTNNRKHRARSLSRALVDCTAENRWKASREWFHVHSHAAVTTVTVTGEWNRQRRKRP